MAAAPQQMMEALTQSPVGVAPEIDLRAMQSLGLRLKDTFTNYKSERLYLEQGWLDALMQYLGRYGDNVLIPEGRSRAYPKLTRSKCVSATARLMAMLFPSEDRNWELVASEDPLITPQDVQKAVQVLQAMGEQPTEKLIRRAIQNMQQKAAERMASVIDGQLEAMRYKNLVRRVVRSAVQYGTGVLRGPGVEQGLSTQIIQDPMTGLWTAQPTSFFKPRLEFVQIWDFYPDMSANDWDGVDNVYFRHVLTRHQFRQLAERPDFIAANIRQWLANNDKGNYDPQYYRVFMKAMGTSTVPTGTRDRIEVLEFWGQVPAAELANVGIEVPEDADGDVGVNIWVVDQTIIKAVVNPYQTQLKPWHVFTYEEDDTTIFGKGIPWIIEDSQRAMSAATRMLLDNASVTTGPMFEVNVDLLVPSGDGDDLAIKPFKVFTRETGGEGATPAIRDIAVENHVADLIQIIEQMRAFATQESAISESAIGDSEPSQESLRTSSGIAMLMGASLVQMRDTVRNFDRFTESVLRSLRDWNNQFNLDPSIQGDHRVIARGSTALVAREMRMAALDQLVATLTPEQAAMIRQKELLRERMKLHELPVEKLLKSAEEIEQDQQQAQQAQAEQQQLAVEKAKADIMQAMSMAFLNIAKGDAATNQAQAQFYESVMRTLGGLSEQATSQSAQGDDTANTPAPGGPALPAPGGVGGGNAVQNLGGPVGLPTGAGAAGSAAFGAGQGLPGIAQ